jgi:hypothetical protein
LQSSSPLSWWWSSRTFEETFSSILANILLTVRPSTPPQERRPNVIGRSWSGFSLRSAMAVPSGSVYLCGVHAYCFSPPLQLSNAARRKARNRLGGAEVLLTFECPSWQPQVCYPKFRRAALKSH